MVREEMMERMSASEFQQWCVYRSVSPFGDYRADYHAALIAKTVANVSGKVIKKDLSIEDCLLKFGQPAGSYQQTPEEMHANFMRIFNFAQAKAAKAKKAS